MSEQKAFKNSLIKLAIIAVCAILYSIGGYGFLAARRFILPTVLTAGMFYFSRDWKVFIQLPVMMFSLAIGYGGAESIWGKILKRGIFGLANGVSSSIYNMIKKNWLLVGFQALLVVASLIVFGSWNPFPSARIEELIIGLFLAAIPMFSVKEKEE